MMNHHFRSHVWIWALPAPARFWSSSVKAMGKTSEPTRWFFAWKNGGVSSSFCWFLLVDGWMIEVRLRGFGISWELLVGFAVIWLPASQNPNAPVMNKSHLYMLTDVDSDVHLPSLVAFGYWPILISKLLDFNWFCKISNQKVMNHDVSSLPNVNCCVHTWRMVAATFFSNQIFWYSSNFPKTVFMGTMENSFHSSCLFLEIRTAFSAETSWQILADPWHRVFFRLDTAFG